MFRKIAKEAAGCPGVVCRHNPSSQDTRGGEEKTRTTPASRKRQASWPRSSSEQRDEDVECRQLSLTGSQKNSTSATATMSAGTGVGTARSHHQLQQRQQSDGQQNDSDECDSDNNDNDLQRQSAILSAPRMATKDPGALILQVTKYTHGQMVKRAQQHPEKFEMPPEQVFPTDHQYRRYLLDIGSP